MKRQAADLEEIFANHMSDKGLHTEYRKNTKQNEAKTQPNKTRAEDLNRLSAKGDKQTANKHIRGIRPPSPHGEQTEALGDYRYTSTGRGDAQEPDVLDIAGGNAEPNSQCGRPCATSLES